MLDNKITALSPMQYIVAALVLLFPTACLLIDRGDSIVFGILALLGFWVGFRDGLTHALKREDWILAAAFFAVATLSYEYGQQTDEGFRFLGRDLRFLLVVPVLMLFRRYPPPAKIVFIGLGIGGLLTGVYVLIGFHSAGSSYRAQAQTDLPVIFGDLTTCIVLTLAAAYGLVVAERK
ncbi:MAG TPA: hypothetical protein VGS41_02550, partial [Chthonomonadales bacterium]|nr:hypothetical protein [Chthonomonadales bacterium]